MTYEQLSIFASTWGLVLLIVLFTIAVAYAFWPTNADKFADAAKLPLDEGEPRS